MTGRKVHRQHVVLSDLERNTLLAVQRLDTVVDIREQFPLWPLEETLEIAETLGVAHPCHPKERLPILMTSDLLLTLDDDDGGRGGMEAIACKPSEELGRTPILQKLEIERVYWERRTVKWSIVTERDVPNDLVLNLLWIDECHVLPESEVDPGSLRDVLSRLPDFLEPGAAAALSKACRACDGELGLKAGSSIKVFRYALSRKIWRVPLDERLEGARPLPTAVLAALLKRRQPRSRSKPQRAA